MCNAGVTLCVEYLDKSWEAWKISYNELYEAKEKQKDPEPLMCEI